MKDIDIDPNRRRRYNVSLTDTHYFNYFKGQWISQLKIHTLSKIHREINANCIIVKLLLNFIEAESFDICRHWKSPINNKQLTDCPKDVFILRV